MNGSCLCGAVGFEVDGEGTPIELCRCRRCRKASASAFAALPIMRREIDHVEIPAGAVDGDPGTRPGCHIFVRSKAPWFESSDELPRFDEGPDRNRRTP